MTPSPRRSQARTREPQPKHPWVVPVLAPADIYAVQALDKGIANESQQRRVVALLLRLADVDRMSFWPGEDGRRASDFAEGKRFVGLQLRRLIRMRAVPLDQASAPEPSA